MKDTAHNLPEYPDSSDPIGLEPDEDGVRHFEVETYAWNVLPKELRTDDLAEGIAREILWLNDRFADEDTQ